MEVKTMVGHNKSMEISLCKWEFFFSFIEYLSDMTRIHINYCKNLSVLSANGGIQKQILFQIWGHFFLDFLYG